jgi:hypothetical protein
VASYEPGNRPSSPDKMANDEAGSCPSEERLSSNQQLDHLICHSDLHKDSFCLKTTQETEDHVATQECSRDIKNDFLKAMKEGKRFVSSPQKDIYLCLRY